MATLRIIDRHGIEHDMEGRTGLKIMEILREHDFSVAAICGGMCSCATCHVYVDLPPPAILHSRHATQLESSCAAIGQPMSARHRSNSSARISKARSAPAGPAAPAP